MPGTVLIVDLNEYALNAWVGACLGFIDLFHNGDGEILSRDPQDGSACDTHHYMTGDAVHPTLWSWWMSKRAIGNAFRMVDDAYQSGIAFEVVVNGQIWVGDDASEAFARAFIGQSHGLHVPSMYPWGDNIDPIDPA